MENKPLSPEIEVNSELPPDRLYVMANPDEQTIRYVNGLTEQERLGWIVRHSGMIINLDTGENE